MSIAPRPAVLHRYFFALLPDEVSARRIRAFAEGQFGPRGLLRPERLHVTLAITSDFDAHQPALVEALLRAGDEVAAAPFELLLNELNGGHRTTALRPAHSQPPLRTLQAEIAQAMTAQGVAMRPEWSFSPHVTLLYRDGQPVWRAVDDLGWPVHDFVLIESLVGMTRHQILRRWPLHAAPEQQLSLFQP